MRTQLVLYTDSRYPLTEEIKQHYPGLLEKDVYLLVNFLYTGLFELYGVSLGGSYKIEIPGRKRVEVDLHKLDKLAINPLEIQYLEQKFKGRFYEDYTRDTVEYLYKTNRLNDNDYQFLLDRLDWTLETKWVKDSYGFFDFKQVPLRWGATEGDDSLIFVTKQNKILDIYSGKNLEDEYLDEVVKDRKRLDMSLIEDKYITEFYRFAFDKNYQGM